MQGASPFSLAEAYEMAYSLKDEKPAAAKPAAQAVAAKKEEKKDEDYSKPGTLPFAELWGPEVNYSDQLANGDADDDKEIEDEDDPRDMICDDDGFVNQFKMTDHQVRQWAREGVQGHKSLLQLSSNIDLGEGRFSEEIADGSVDDDKELIDINDKEDDLVDENMIQLDSSLQQRQNDGVHGRGYFNPGPAWQTILSQGEAKHSVDASLY